MTFASESARSETSWVVASGTVILRRRERRGRTHRRLGVLREPRDDDDVARNARVTERGEQRALLDDGARREQIATKHVGRANRGIGITGREGLTGGRAERVCAGRADVVRLAPALGVDAHEEAERRAVRAVDEAEALDVAREGAVVAAGDAEREEAANHDLRLERPGSGEEIEDPAAELIARRLVLEHHAQRLALASRSAEGARMPRCARPPRALRRPGGRGASTRWSPAGRWWRARGGGMSAFFGDGGPRDGSAAVE